MVSNIYIDEMLKNVKGFKGTFSSNDIPFLLDNESAIINFSKFNEKGTHFIAIFKNSKYLYYFDSLDLGFIPNEIKKYFTNYKAINNVSKGIQHFSSVFCGFYSILAILCFHIEPSFFLKNVLPHFKIRNLENDEKCIRLIKEIYPCLIKFQ